MSTGQVVTLPLIPIRDVVVFPQTMFPFIIGRSPSIVALEKALQQDRRLFLATQKDPTIDEPAPEDIFHCGTLTLVIQNMRLPEGNIKVLVEGLQRGRIISIQKEDGYFSATVELMEEKPVRHSEEQDLRQALSEAFEEYSKVNPGFNLESALRVLKGSDLSKVTDNLAGLVPAGVKEKQDLLEKVDPLDRMKYLTRILSFEIEKLKIDKNIQNRVREQMDKAQKDYYLHEKIRAIQKELGEEDQTSELDDLKKKVEDSGMTKDACDKASKEIRRLEAMPSMSAEATVSRNYVDWLLSLPWKIHSKEVKDIRRAEQVLEEDHYGLEKIKERILEFLAVRQMTKKSQGTILCLVGPPGVGKTSLGRSIARATGRKFVRFSLGGVRDEAEIRGHRRTYIGAFPGQIIQLLKKAGTKNPVFLLDEVDKMSMDFRGDPSAALLEVLDPEQNSHFVDHFIDSEFDLSQVMFIATANVLHQIPRPLQDRMEVLELSGYTEKEKLEIGRRYLLGKQLKACGLTSEQVEFTDDALLAIIQNYTRESGVRNLEREIGKVCRKLVRTILSEGGSECRRVDGTSLAGFLGAPKFRVQRGEERNEVGVATGMAWTEVGGELLLTEATCMPGTGKLTLTGKLGDVMQESAQAAMSYVRSRTETFGIDPEFYKKNDFHVHFPEGAIPKDGPSAGITMATAILSCVTGIPVRSDLAMTGEITLRGKVLPIGGVKEKVLAAHRGGLLRILLPGENRKDLEEIPAEVRSALEILFVETMDQVLPLALEHMPAPKEPVEASLSPELGSGRSAN